VIYKDIIECHCGRIRIVDFSTIEKALKKRQSITHLVKSAQAWSPGTQNKEQTKVNKVFEDIFETNNKQDKIQ